MNHIPKVHVIAAVYKLFFFNLNPNEFMPSGLSKIQNLFSRSFHILGFIFSRILQSQIQVIQYEYHIQTNILNSLLSTLSYYTLQTIKQPGLQGFAKLQTHFSRVVETFFPELQTHFSRVIGTFLHTYRHIFQGL